MTITISVPPEDEPVTVDQQQAWSRITDEAEGSELERLIVTARTHVEHITQRALMPQTLVARLDGFSCDEICLERPPVQSVTSVQYLDTDGNTQTVSASWWEVDIYSSPARIMLKPGYAWPVTALRMNAVIITYVAGYADADAVPMPIRHAISMLVDHWYENRSPVIVGATVAEVPLSVENMLFPYRVW